MVPASTRETIEGESLGGPHNVGTDTETIGNGHYELLRAISGRTNRVSMARPNRVSKCAAPLIRRSLVVFWTGVPSSTLPRARQERFAFSARSELRNQNKYESRGRAAALAGAHYSCIDYLRWERVLCS